MRRLIRTVAALAMTATPVLGVLVAVHPDGIMADNGVISTDDGGVISTNGGGVLHSDDNGVINSNGVGGSGSFRILADDGVVNSKN
jgi:hypothetical protein